jgi:hypothetical protein
MKKEFILAGRAVFTLDVPVTFQLSHEAKPHYTYRVKFKKANDQYSDAYFVNLLTGPDNTKDYSYLGMLDKNTGKVRLTGKSCATADDLSYKLLIRALARVWSDEIDLLEKHGFHLHHEGRCGRCGRILTAPESCTTGIGPECTKYIYGVVPKAVHGIPEQEDEEMTHQEILDVLKH